MGFTEVPYFYSNLNHWNTSKVTDMSFMFLNAQLFDNDLSYWYVSNVTNMSYMFAGATLFNSDISSWNVSNVTNMEGMFYGSINFNQDLSLWDIRNVKVNDYIKLSENVLVNDDIQKYKSIEKNVILHNFVKTWFIFAAYKIIQDALNWKEKGIGYFFLTVFYNVLFGNKYI